MCCEIISIADFGVFVSIEEGVEGLIHISELSMKKIENPTDIAKVGEQITAEIMNIDSKDRKIRLSKKSIESNAEKTEYASYVAKHGSARSQMADLIAAATSNGADDENAENAPDTDTSDAADTEASEPVTDVEETPVENSEEVADDTLEEKKDESASD